MGNIWTIARREYKLYFSTPIAYVISAVTLFVLGLIFYVSINAVAMQLSQFTPGIEIILSPFAFILVFAIPALTMRLLADEHRLGTIELLQTAPVQDWEVVAGKWLGALLFVASLAAFTWVFPIILNALIEPGIDQGPLLSGYLGILLLSSAFIAVGVAVSSFFNNLVASFVTTMGLNLFMWWLIGIPAQLSSPQFATVFRYLDFAGHFNNTMLRGVIELGDPVYYLSITALGLVVATLSLEARRWR